MREAALLAGSQVHPPRPDLHALDALAPLRRLHGRDRANVLAGPFGRHPPSPPGLVRGDPAGSMQRCKPIVRTADPPRKSAGLIRRCGIVRLRSTLGAPPPFPRRPFHTSRRESRFFMADLKVPVPPSSPSSDAVSLLGHRPLPADLL